MYSYKYPHPAVTTDSVVFGFDGKKLHILLIERGIDPYKGSWALPGGFMNIDETAEQCAARELAEETGVKDIYLEQFHTFSDVNRDPRERVITIAFFALVRKSDFRLLAGDDAAGACWFDIEELPPLAFDHVQIIKSARVHLREALKNRPIAFRLLDEKFSMDDLRRLYEAINDTTYDRRNFAKKMTATGLLREEAPSVHRSVVSVDRDRSFGAPEISLSKCRMAAMEEEGNMPAPCGIIGMSDASIMSDSIEPIALHSSPKLRLSSGRTSKPAPRGPRKLFSFDEEAFNDSKKKKGKNDNPFEI